MDERKQLKARVSDNIRKEVDAACDALKITKQNFVEQAVLAKLCKIDVDIRAHRLSAENTTLSVERQQFKSREEHQRSRNPSVSPVNVITLKANGITTKSSMRTRKKKLAQARGRFRRV